MKHLLHPLFAAGLRVYLFFFTKVIYVVALSAACLVNAVNIPATLAALKARKIFTPAGKWSPLSFMKLTHEVRARGKACRFHASP